MIVHDLAEGVVYRFEPVLWLLFRSSLHGPELEQAGCVDPFDKAVSEQRGTGVDS
jgi:hypothetical protein